MRADIENQLLSARDTAQAGLVLRAACAAYGEVVRTGIVCSAGADETLTGFVEMRDRIAIKIARRLGVGNVGTRLVVFRFRAPIPSAAPEAAATGAAVPVEAMRKESY